MKHSCATVFWWEKLRQAGRAWEQPKTLVQQDPGEGEASAYPGRGSSRSGGDPLEQDGRVETTGGVY